ncbi:hypothetical protein LUZ60_017707 [Juncus effusus]|nr:hypothetical protein LUZ60_017707 [Juncus effusus]
MAEAVVDFVCEKLQDAIKGPIKDAILQEGLILYEVEDKAEAVQRELSRIKSFLKDVDARREGDQRMQYFVREIRQVAYDIEDSIDKFQAGVDESRHKEPGFCHWIKIMFKKSMLIPSLHTLAHELESIQTRITEISTGKINYGVEEGSGQSSRPPIRRIVIQKIEETGIVGFESDKKNIIRQLLDEKNSRRAVVSIVGPGGIGKTTLAHAVYNSTEVEKTFEVRIWLWVSQEYTLIDLLKEMNEKIHRINPREQNQEEVELLQELHDSMKKKKYFVVLDDIWTEDVWPQLETSFPDVNNGSRVLVTSRKKFVPKAIDPINTPYELKCLSEEESLKLLLKKALPGIEPPKGYPNDLTELARQFVKKCDGLPLQLVVLGGLLSIKNRSHSDWQRVMNNLDWFSYRNNCFDIISSSYEDLPAHLKSCFMSFSVFPEDYEIKTSSLISYWMVEGFIPNEEMSARRERALSYLDELIDRCMVQVVQRNPHGAIEIIRLHELLRNLAIHEAEEKNFITIFKKLDDYEESHAANARHASFHFYTSEMKGNSREEKDVILYTGENVRSIMFFGKFLPVKSKLRLLKVLVIYRADVVFYYDGKHCWFDKLIGLRHLEFRECVLQNNALPETIKRLYNLKYLDLTDTFINDLPKSLKFTERPVDVVANRVGIQS